MNGEHFQWIYAVTQATAQHRTVDSTRGTIYSYSTLSWPFSISKLALFGQVRSSTYFSGGLCFMQSNEVHIVSAFQIMDYDKRFLGVIRF